MNARWVLSIEYYLHRWIIENAGYVMFIIVENEIGDLISNPGEELVFYFLLILLRKAWIHKLFSAQLLVNNSVSDWILSSLDLKEGMKVHASVMLAFIIFIL